jgi:hypothetical protein
VPSTGFVTISDNPRVVTANAPYRMPFPALAAPC